MDNVINLFNAESLSLLKRAPANSIDAVVTDPPYGLSFMGKKWDYDVPSVEIWKEILRVLKPGGHLLSFGGTRTYHRMVVAIEDAGFEIRDQIQWLYGSGFPKSLDISKAIDKAAGAEREVIGKKWVGRGNRATNAVYGEYDSPHTAGCDVTAPSTDAAKQWSGWGTALKPANEPIVLARKPLEKGLTIAQNVLKWGTGGLNIDATRIVTQEKLQSGRHITGNQQGPSGYKTTNRTEYDQNSEGRFPANLILDEVAAEMLDTQQADVSRFFYVAKASQSERNKGLENRASAIVSDGREKSIDNPFLRGETERKNTHPTVKPIKLMEYLVKLITPPGGKVLDPFMGSGTTGIAAVNLGFKFVGIEREKEFFEIAKARINFKKMR